MKKEQREYLINSAELSVLVQYATPNYLIGHTEIIFAEMAGYAKKYLPDSLVSHLVKDKKMSPIEVLRTLEAYQAFINDYFSQAKREALRRLK